MTKAEFFQELRARGFQPVRSDSLWKRGAMNYEIEVFVSSKYQVVARAWSGDELEKSPWVEDPTELLPVINKYLFGADR